MRYWSLALSVVHDHIACSTIQPPIAIGDDPVLLPHFKLTSSSEASSVTKSLGLTYCG